MKIKERQFLTLPGTITATSLQLPSRLSWEECRTVGLRLAQFKQFLKFAIGDLLVYAEQHFGERYVQLAAEMGLSSEEAYQLHYVCSRVGSLSRDKSLFWSHHKEVAKLAPKEQGKWLAQAAKERWNLKTLIGALEEKGLRKPTRSNAASHEAEKEEVIHPVVIRDSVARSTNDLVDDSCPICDGPDAVCLICARCLRSARILFEEKGWIKTKEQEYGEGR